MTHGPLVLALIVAVTSASGVLAQGRGGPPQPAANPRAGALIDLAGYWVSVVTEDWRWRMVTPPKGDYASVPMTREARTVADAWDISKDGSCLAYGAAGLLRIPTRLRFSWESDTVLRLETDAGVQTRRFVFDGTRPPGARSLQGFSRAEWEPAGGRGVQGGALKVTTTNMTGGWVRKNGVPYSANAVLTEYLRPLPRSERRGVDQRDNDRRRSTVLHTAVHHHHALQKGTRRLEVESVAVSRYRLSQRGNCRRSCASPIFRPSAIHPRKRSRRSPNEDG